jgi:hypothetical protein
MSLNHLSEELLTSRVFLRQSFDEVNCLRGEAELRTRQWGVDMQVALVSATKRGIHISFAHNYRGTRISFGRKTILSPVWQCYLRPECTIVNGIATHVDWLLDWPL